MTRHFPSVSDIVDAEIVGLENQKPEVLSGTKALSPESIELEATQDPIFILAQQSPDSGDLLNQILRNLAHEAALLSLERQTSNVKDRFAVSDRRVKALKALGDVWAKRRELSMAMIDMEGLAFKTLFKFILETFLDCLSDSGLRSEQIDTVISNLQKRMNDDWKLEAKVRMKAAR